MKSQKLIAVSAMIGFFLSSFTGFVGGVGLLVIFIRALIFGIIFGVIGWGAGFIAEKFLDVSSGESSSFSTPEKPAAAKTANVVDITIADENLPAEEQEPGFSVTKAVRSYHGVLDGQTSPEPASTPHGKLETEHKSMVVSESESIPEVEKVSVVDAAETVRLTDSSEDSASPVAAAKADAVSAANAKDKNFEGFVPDLGAASAIVTETVTPKEENNSVSNSDSGLDELPDLSELVDVDAKEGGTTISDSDFASSGPSRTEHRERSASVPDIKNTELLAQAIRSAIAKDD